MSEVISATRFRVSAVLLPERLMTLGVMVSVTLVGWARLPWEARKVVWAEDGELFLSELVHLGFWPTLFKSYAGYLQFWPRIFTEIAFGGGDLGLYSDRIAFMACLGAAIVAGGVFVWSKRIVGSPGIRALLAVLPVLVSTAPLEVLGNVANLHWIVLWGSAWLLIHRPATWKGAVPLSVLAFTFAATEIQVLFLAPLLLLDVRSKRSWLVRAGLIAGSAAQVASTLANPRPAVVGDHFGEKTTVLGYLINGPFSILVGDASTAGTVLARFGWPVAAVSIVPFLIALAYVLLRGRRAVRFTAAVFVFTSCVAWFAAFYMNVTTPMTTLAYATFGPAQFEALTFLRYGYVPSLFLLAIPVLAISTWLERGRADTASELRWGTGSRPMFAAAAVGVSVVVLLLQIVWFTPAVTLRTGQPEWGQSVEQARAACAVTGAREAVVVQAPQNWATSIPCRILND